MPRSVRVKRGSEVRVVSPDYAELLIREQGWSLAESDVQGSSGTIVETETGQKALSPELATSEYIRGTAIPADTGAGSRARRAAAADLKAARASDLDAVQAFGEGGLTTLLPVVGDAIVEGLEGGISGDTDLVAGRAEDHQYASLAGQAVGGIAGGLAGTSKKAGISLLGGAPALASKAGISAGKNVAGMAGRLAAEGATEGLLFGGSQAVSNAMLHDKPLTAEAFVAEAGSGALFGGALGGALGLAGAGFSKLAGRSQKRGAVESLASFEDDALRGAALDDITALRSAFDDVNFQAKATGRNADEFLAQRDLDDAIEAVARHSDELAQAEQSTLALKQQIQQAKAEGQLIAHGNVGLIKNLEEQLLTQTAQAKGLKEAIARAKGSAKAAEGSVTSAQKVALTGLADQTKLNKAQLAAAKKGVTDLGKDGSSLFAKLGSKASGEVDALGRGLDEAFEYLQAKGTAPDLKLGPAIASSIDGKELRAAAEAAELTEAIKLLDNVKPGMPSEAVVQSWVLQQIKRKVGTPDATGYWQGLAGLAVGNLARRPAGALGQLTNVLGAAYIKAKTGVVDGVSAFVRGAAKTRKAHVPVATTILGKIRFDPNVGEPAEKGSAFKLRAAELNRAVSDPGKTQTALNKKLSPVTHLDPELGQLAAQSAMAKLQFYHAKMPRNPLESQGLYRVGRWEPPASEVARFARYIRAGEDPLSLLSDMENGRITPEAVEAVKTLYPEIYSRIQLELVTQLSEPGAVEALNYSKRVQLKIFFDLPTDPTLTDEFYATMQDLYVMRAEQAQQGNGNYSTPGAVSKAPGLTELPTAAQRIEQ